MVLAAPTVTSPSTTPPASSSPTATRCGGVLKPDVVFFGENVPPRGSQRCYDAVDALTAATPCWSWLVADGDVRPPVRRRAAKAGIPS